MACCQASKAIVSRCCRTTVYPRLLVLSSPCATATDGHVAPATGGHVSPVRCHSYCQCWRGAVRRPRETWVVAWGRTHCEDCASVQNRRGWNTVAGLRVMADHPTVTNLQSITNWLGLIMQNVLLISVIFKPNVQATSGQQHNSIASEYM